MGAEQRTAALTMGLNKRLPSLQSSLFPRPQAVEAEPSTLIGSWSFPRLTERPSVRPCGPLIATFVEIQWIRQEPLPVRFGVTCSSMNT